MIAAAADKALMDGICWLFIVFLFLFVGSFAEILLERLCDVVIG